MLNEWDKTRKNLKEASGKRIAALEFKGDTLFFTFEDGSRLNLYDGGQDCCEYRHAECDSDLSAFIGAIFYGVGDLREEERNDGVCHDVEFVDIKTDRGVFTLVNHNEHNGYYGGFSITARNPDDA